MAMRDRVAADLDRIRDRVDHLQKVLAREQAAVDSTKAELLGLRAERDEIRAWLDAQP